MDFKILLKFIKKKKRTYGDLEHFCEEKKGMDILNFALKKGYIICSEIVTITPKGEEYLNKKSWLDRKQIIPALVTIVISLSAIWISYNSLQVQIDSLTPNEPELYIYTDDKPHVLYGQTLSTNISKGEKVRLNIQNTGSVETQHMTIKLINPTYLRDSGENIKTILGGRTESAVIYIKTNNCYDNCNYTDLPDGIIPLTFEITCTNCNAENKKFNKTIDFCIYKNNYSVCEI